MNGWIKINREITDHWLWQDAERLKWWLDLLFLASYEDKKAMHDSHLFTLRRGQIIASISFLSQRWGKGKHTIINYLKLLENECMIERYVLHRQTSIITICNYDRYQCNDNTSLHTIAHTIAHTQNDENLCCAVHTQKTDLNTSNTDSLRCAANDELHTIAHPLVHTIVHTNKEIKNNISLEEKKRACVRICEDEDGYIQEHLAEDVLFTNMRNNRAWQEQAICMKYHITRDECLNLIDGFEMDCKCQNMTHADAGDIYRHFANWLKIQKNVQSKTDKTNGKDSRRGTYEVSATDEGWERAF